MSMTNGMETKVLDLFFNNTPLTNLGDAAGLPASVGEGQFYMSLHIAPGLAETDTEQNVNETTYTGYDRQAIVRNSAGFIVVGDNASNAALVQAGTMTAGGPVTLVDFGLGFELTLPGELQFFAVLDAPLIVNDGINPQFSIGQLVVTAN